MRKETEDETQFTTKIGGGGLEPITNYRIKHVDTHFFKVVKDASWGYYRGQGSYKKVNILMSVQVQPDH